MLNETMMTTGLGAAAVGTISAMTAQLLPGIPDDFRSWPFYTVCAVIALAGMSLAWMALSKSFKQGEKTTDSLSKIAAEMGRMNDKHGETNQKIGETNTGLHDLVTELRTRKCLTKD